ncbi:glycoside hydrolase family 26 protein [Prevotella lacticifex]|nr:glycosyl hydrolase [Prevotella lacticifex]GJG66940.1 mannan endo-1,4-beta-mannosidase [Prevotella lacticifex]
MKNVLKILLFAAGILCSGTATAAQTPAQKLMKRMMKLQKRGIMVGHQDDPMYGSTWSWDENRSDVLEVTGDYPAVMGFDLGELELGNDKNLDKVPFDRLRREAIAQYQRGGIVTISWHPHNPVTSQNAWDPSGEPVKKILEGGDVRDKFMGWLKTVATFLKTLKTPDGKQIPIVFRPWHEMNGGWFWWGKNSCTPEEYKQFFKLTHETFDREGLKDYLVWAWSPNLDGTSDTKEKFMECYPGDDLVDLVGIDIYEFDNSDSNYIANTKAELKIMTECARQQKKLAAFTETGCRGINHKSDWFMQTLYPVLQQFSGQLSYVLFWRNDFVNPDQEAYLPNKGSNAAPDFKKFEEQKDILFLKDIKKTK